MLGWRTGPRKARDAQVVALTRPQGCLSCCVMARKQAAALTVAGSDSGGGAGIQADLKTFAALGVFGASAITCLTAQNPREVAGVHPVPAPFVAEQIRAVFRGIPVRAAKTGMLFSAEIIEAAADALVDAGVPIVVDPVMVASSGARLLREDAVDRLLQRLIPCATVVTPNVPEAEILAGQRIDGIEALRRVASDLSRRWGTACLLKGGHLDTGRVVTDILAHGGALETFVSPRIAGVSTHGSGCTLSAAIAAFLARGCELVDACHEAHDYLARALAHPIDAWGEPSIHHITAKKAKKGTGTIIGA